MRLRTAEGRAKRDAAFLAWRRRGATLREIAEAAECSIATVWLGCRRAEAAEREKGVIDG